MTATVAITKVAEVVPAETVTDPGRVAADRLLESATTVPPEPAGPVKVIVPDDGCPPITLVGLRVRDESAAAVIVRVAF